MSSFRSEPFLWIHLAGLAVVPLFWQIVWLGLAVGFPLSFFWLELIFLAVVGILPVLWMQWNRPFDIFSLLLLSLKPEVLTEQQRRILSLFSGKKQRLLALFTAAVMLLVLWQIYRLAPLASWVTPLPAQGRIVGLLVAAVAFLASNLFVQVPVSVLSVLLTSEQQFAATEPMALAKISQTLTIVGF